MPSGVAARSEFSTSEFLFHLLAFLSRILSLLNSAERAKRSVKNVSGFVHMGFREEEMARSWLKAYLEGRL